MGLSARHSLPRTAIIPPSIHMTRKQLPVVPDVGLETLCQYGYTRTIRPPYSVTNAIKIRKLRELGLTEADKSRFELDHKIPLCLAGTSSWENLQLEPWPAAMIKDR